MNKVRGKIRKPNNRPKAVISIVKLVTCCRSETCGFELCLSPRKDSYIYLDSKVLQRTCEKICLLKTVTKCMNYFRQLSLFYEHTKDTNTNTSYRIIGNERGYNNANVDWRSRCVQSRIKHNMQWISLDFIVQVVDVEHESSNCGHYEPKNLTFPKTVIFYLIYPFICFWLHCFSLKFLCMRNFKLLKDGARNETWT